MRPKLLSQKDSDSASGTGTPTEDASGTPSEDASGTPSATGAPLPAKSSSSTGAIAGGVVGGLAALAALAGLFFFLRRRRSRVHGDSSTADTSTSAAGAPLYQVHEAPVADEYLHRHECAAQEDGYDAVVPRHTGVSGAGRVVMGELPGDSIRRGE